jgi:hypothetical protein
MYRPVVPQCLSTESQMYLKIQMLAAASTVKAFIAALRPDSVLLVIATESDRIYTVYTLALHYQGGTASSSPSWWALQGE